MLPTAAFEAAYESVRDKEPQRKSLTSAARNRGYLARQRPHHDDLALLSLLHQRDYGHNAIRNSQLRYHYLDEENSDIQRWCRRH